MSKNVDDLLMQAWGVIANAGFREGEDKSPGWHEAAVRWRDDFHEYIDEQGWGTTTGKAWWRRLGRRNRS